jgi:hypothetical protein
MSARRKRASREISLGGGGSQANGPRMVYSTEIKSEIPQRIAQDVPHKHVSTVVVDNPLRGQINPETGEVERAKHEMLRTNRDDILAEMHSAGEISELELAAGRKWEALAFRAQLGGAKANDPSRVVVDCSPSFDLLTDDQIRARFQLEQARVPLGERGYALVGWFLDRRLTRRQCADMWGRFESRGVNFIGKRFAECLSTLADLWMPAAIGKGLTTCQAKRYG